MSRRIKDHLGNEYKSLKALAEHYNIDYDVLRMRLRRGVNLELALTLGVTKGIPCTDHLGNEFPSRTAMAKYYGLREVVLKMRLYRGMPLAEALLRPEKSRETEGILS